LDRRYKKHPGLLGNPPESTRENAQESWPIGTSYVAICTEAAAHCAPHLARLTLRG